MKVVALVSGGKDSCYNMVKCVEHGHEIVCLANLAPPDRSIQELDSWCFQTVGHNAISAIAQCMDLPLYQQDLRRSSKVTSLEYCEFEEEESEKLSEEKLDKVAKLRPVVEDEVEDLFLLLSRVKKDFPDVTGVSCGAIFSDYQRFRVENVCGRLGLVSLTYLWRRDQSELLDEMIQSGICAVMIKTASMGLNPRRDCGKTLGQLQSRLEQLKVTADLNVCGEGGEYETFTIDCPIFKRRIVLDKTRVVMDSEDPFAPVGYLLIEEFHLEDKQQDEEISMEKKSKSVEQMSTVGTTWSNSVRSRNDLLTQEQLTLVEAMVQSGDKVSVQCRVCNVTDDRGLMYDTCHIVVTWNGNSIDDSGDADSSLLLSSSPLLQCAIMMDSVNQQLRQSNFSMSDLVHNILVLRSMSDFTAVNSIYSTYFKRHPPSRVCIADDTIGGRLSIECFGARLNHGQMDRETLEENQVDLSHWKKVLHVQSISEWAPACIGPYSQATQIDQIIRVAGQIAMEPHSMNIRAGASIDQEVAQCLRNVNNTLEALNSNLGQCVRFVVYYCEEALGCSVSSLRQMIVDQCTRLHVGSSDMTCVHHHMILVPVSALPRGATVEVHAFAVSNSLGITFESQPSESVNAQVTRHVCSVVAGKHKYTQIKLSGLVTDDAVIRELHSITNSLKHVQSLRVFSRGSTMVNSSTIAVSHYRYEGDVTIEVEQVLI